MEDVSNQLRQDIFEDNHIYKKRVQTALSDFRYNYLDLVSRY